MTVILNPPRSTEDQRKINGRLWFAVCENDSAAAAAALNDGADPNCRVGVSLKGITKKTYGMNPDNSRPLWAAARCGHAHMAIWLIEKGAEINDIDGDGNTALMEAIESSNYAAARAIFDHGADSFMRTKKAGLCALDLAQEKAGFSELADLMKTRRQKEKETQIAEAVTKALQQRQEIPAAAWENEDEVIVQRRAAGRPLTEVFNMRTRDRISFFTDPVTGAPGAMARESFSMIDDQEAVRAAFNLYRARGGKISEAEIFGVGLTREILKTPVDFKNPGAA